MVNNYRKKRMRERAAQMGKYACDRWYKAITIVRTTSEMPISRSVQHARTPMWRGGVGMLEGF